MMTITDTHTHLYHQQFDNDRDEMIQRALEQGVSRFFLPAIDASHTEAMLALRNKYPELMFMMAGVHPTSVKLDWQNEVAHAKLVLEAYKCVAIGEIGIDLYWDKTLLKAQQDAFKAQIEIAKVHELPIVIHCREAFDEVFEVLDESRPCPKGVFHCFSGTLEQAKKVVSYGMSLGIGGVITYKNSNLKTVLREIDLSHIVLETDAPYLSPVPKRGQRNESAFVVYTLEALASVYNMPTSLVAEQTTSNSKTLFGV